MVIFLKTKSDQNIHQSAPKRIKLHHFKKFSRGGHDKDKIL